MPGLQTNHVIQGTDLRWLGTSQYRPARTGVINVAAFTANLVTGGVRYGSPSKGFIPAGTPVTRDGDHYVPWTAGNDFDGVLLTNVSLYEVGDDPHWAVAILDDGRIYSEFMPQVGGVPFTAPSKAENNTSIVFV